jgi:hypothetical protein
VRAELKHSEHFTTVQMFPPECVGKEHANIKMTELLNQMVYPLNTAPQLCKHQHSFYDITRKAVDQRHYKIGIFCDGFPLFSNNNKVHV